MIVKKTLPHGKVPLDGIKDQASRFAVMRLNENIACLAKQVSELQDASKILDVGIKAALAKISEIQSAQ